MQTVDIKGVGPADFPDNMSQDSIRDFLRTQSFQQQTAAKPTLASMNRPQTIQPVEQTLPQKGAQAVSDYLFNNGIITDRYRAQEIGKNISTLGEFNPVYGAAVAGDEFGTALRKGDKAGMALSSLGRRCSREIKRAWLLPRSVLFLKLEQQERQAPRLFQIYLSLNLQSYQIKLKQGERLRCQCGTCQQKARLKTLST